MQAFSHKVSCLFIWNCQRFFYIMQYFPTDVVRLSCRYQEYVDSKYDFAVVDNQGARGPLIA